MTRKFKVVLALVMMLVFIFFGGCYCNKKQKRDNIDELVRNSGEFIKMDLTIDLSSQQVLLYSKKVDLIKCDLESEYTITTNQLSKDLYSQSQYTKLISDGKVNNEVVNEFFLSFNEIRLECLKNYFKEDNTIYFLVEKKNIISVFADWIPDINTITSDGINVVLEVENKRIKEYRFSYIIDDQIEVVIKGKFKY